MSANKGVKFNGIKPLARFADQAKALAFSTPLYNLTLMGGSPDNLHVIPTDPWPGRSDVGQDIMQGVFTFAGETVEMDTLTWEPAGVSDNWVADFHRFNWLRDVKAVCTGQARLQAREMISNWIDHYDRWQDVIWRPDVLGARLSNWIGAFSFYGLSADEEFQAKVRLSIAKQTKHLARVVTDGHLEPVQSFAALKGLIYAMIAIGSPKKQLEHPFEMVLEEIKSQILVDGGHISRSPIKLSQVLMILIDLRTVLNLAKLPVPEQIQFAIDKMVPALRFFRYGDGNLAHFNGGYEWDANLINCIVNLSGARGRPLKRLEHTGYTKLRQGRGQLMIDTGSAIDAEHSRSIHTAPLAFEYVFGRERIFVNCGAVSEYGHWFEAMRATAAHSTLTVDQRNAVSLNEQGEFTTLPNVHSEYCLESASCLFEGHHDGYMARYGIEHGRRFYLKDAGNVLIGEDKLTGGGAGVPFALRFHLHPSSQATLLQSGGEILIQTKSRSGWRFIAKGAETIGLDESVYIGHRGEIRRAQHIVVRGKTENADTIVKWGLSRIIG